MDTSERSQLLTRLADSRTKLLETVGSLTPEQWTFRPSAGEWSIADCLEHLMIVENRVIAMIPKILAGPPQPDKKSLVAGKDELIQREVPGRVNRFNAPEMAHPKNGYLAASQALADFDDTRARVVQFATDTEADLRSYFYQHPVFGELDCYQWLMLIALHCERHTNQMNELKSHPSFGSLTTSA